MIWLIFIVGAILAIFAFILNHYFNNKKELDTWEIREQERLTLEREKEQKLQQLQNLKETNYTYTKSEPIISENNIMPIKHEPIILGDNFIIHSEPVVAENKTMPTKHEHSKIIITAKDLDFDDVIEKFLTKGFGNCPCQYDFDVYLQAELNCILENLKVFPIEPLPNNQLLIKNDINNFNIECKNLTKSTSLRKIKNFIAIDTETTGLKATKNEIIEVTAIKFIDFEPTEIFTTLVKPIKAISSKITSINGITNEMVEDSPAFGEIATQFTDFIKGFTLVAHNAPFDLEFLFANGIEFDEKLTSYDTLQLSRKLVKDWDGEPIDNYKLATVCEECGIYLNDTHRATMDCLGAGLLFIELIKLKMEQNNILSLMSIH